MAALEMITGHDDTAKPYIINSKHAEEFIIRKDFKVFIVKESINYGGHITIHSIVVISENPF